MSENFGTRVMVPVVSRAGRIARRVTPLDTRDRIRKKLLLAGSPAGWDAERVLAFKIIGAVAGFVGRAARYCRSSTFSSVPPDRDHRAADVRRVHRCPTPS